VLKIDAKVDVPSCCRILTLWIFSKSFWPYQVHDFMANSWSIQAIFFHTRRMYLKIEPKAHGNWKLWSAKVEVSKWWNGQRFRNFFLVFFQLQFRLLRAIFLYDLSWFSSSVLHKTCSMLCPLSIDTNTMHLCYLSMKLRIFKEAMVGLILRSNYKSLFLSKQRWTLKSNLHTFYSQVFSDV
jgi:hypothetical protein